MNILITIMVNNKFCCFEETIEARVHASEPVSLEAENITSQKEKAAQSSDILKRKSVHSDAAEATPSLARRLKKMKARRFG